MTFVVTENCIKCKYMDCVEVCPVDCFHEGPNFLAIDPEECIDCTLCEPECPVEAIIPDSETEAESWLELFGETCGELFDDSLAEAFRAKALRIAESLKLALFYRPDRPRPRSVP